MKKQLPSLLLRIAFLILFVFLIITKRFQLWLIIYIAGVLLSPIFGRIYCGYACPMNTVMRPVQKFSRKRGIQKEKVPTWLESPKLAYAVLILSLATMLLGKRVLGRDIPILLILFLTSLVVTFFVKSTVWHNGLCPYSVLLRIGGRFARYSRQVDPSSCERTQKCIKVCPSGAITMAGIDNKAIIDPATCHQCEACSSVCPHSAISYTKIV